MFILFKSDTVDTFESSPPSLLLGLRHTKAAPRAIAPSSSLNPNCSLLRTIDDVGNDDDEDDEDDDNDDNDT